MLQIYLIDQRAYEAGFKDIGKWIYLPASVEFLASQIHEVLNKAERVMKERLHESYCISEHSWQDFPLFQVKFHSNLFYLNNLICKLVALDEKRLEAITFLLKQNYTDDLEDAILRADDVTVHSKEEAKAYIEDLGFTLLDGKVYEYYG